MTAVAYYQVSPFRPEPYETAPSLHPAVSLNVLIIGESGVGKEPLAQEIYDVSTKSNKPCVLLDCGTLHYLSLNHNPKQPMTLLDAVTAQFRKAQGGTVILDNMQGYYKYTTPGILSVKPLH